MARAPKSASGPTEPLIGEQSGWPLSERYRPGCGSRTCHRNENKGLGHVDERHREAADQDRGMGDGC